MCGRIGPRRNADTEGLGRLAARYRHDRAALDVDVAREIASHDIDADGDRFRGADAIGAVVAAAIGKSGHLNEAEVGDCSSNYTAVHMNARSVGAGNAVAVRLGTRKDEDARPAVLDI